MRTKKAVYNNLAAALLQITTLIFGLVLPRLMIKTYGSELNGLVSSTKQVISYLYYLEVGMTASLVFSLYQPLAKRNYDEINPLVARAKKEYEKISVGYFIGTILLSLIYPLLLKENLGYAKVLFLMLLVGINGSLNFLTLSKYRALLEADQKYYIINLITIITTILQNVISIIFMVFNKSIFLVLFVPIVFLPIRSLLLKLYVRTNYKQINYRVEASKIKFTYRKDAFISGLSNTINVSMPLIIVSLIISLEMASVFSVYSMVFGGIIGILSVFSTGTKAAFGNMIGREEYENLRLTKGYFEIVYYAFMSVVYATAAALIIPFITLYVANADINYIYPSIGILYTIWSIAYGAGVVHQAVLYASGQWKIATKTNIIQAFILIGLMLVLGHFFGVDGILIAMIVGTAYKTLTLMYLSNKKILNISSNLNFRRIIRIYIVILIVNLPLLLGWVTINPANFWEWVIWAIIIVLISIIITFLFNAIFEWRVIKEIYDKYIKRIFKKRKK